MSTAFTGKVIECVPNFSEGRDWKTIEAIHESILSVSGCEVWDHSADTDHNRSVFTIAGTPEGLEEAAVRFTAAAAKLIDMRVHQGCHPCIGAADVIPFIPLKNADMQDCIALSEKVGSRIADELHLPVYLYAQSARTPAHKRLADIRRGGYSRLQAEIDSVPERAPDLGPKVLPPAGGVSVGARDFLIAFNVYLDSSEVSPAKEIARRIRESSGGLPGVQAIGLLVNHQAQVSMNLLNYRKTSMKAVFEAISFHAAGMGARIDHSELIGMLPQDALRGTSAADLLIRDFSEDKIIERHL